MGEEKRRVVFMVIVTASIKRARCRLLSAFQNLVHACYPEAPGGLHDSASVVETVTNRLADLVRAHSHLVVESASECAVVLVMVPTHRVDTHPCGELV